MPSGVDCLDYYTKKIEAQTGLITEVPVHNQYSHGADAFRTFVEAAKAGMLEGRATLERQMRNAQRPSAVTRERPSGWQENRRRVAH